MTIGACLAWNDMHNSTPTSGAASIRLNSLDLVDVHRSTLNLYDLYGTIVGDKTNELYVGKQQRRYEFTYETQHLPPGFYMLVHQDHKGRIEKCIMFVGK